MTAAAVRPVVTACRRYDDRPAVVLETIPVSRHDNTLMDSQHAGELGNGAHAGADRNGTMRVVRPIGTTS
ncbi:hypothetical protein OG612_45230 (plasmid) [Streptomyces sp. NBC_01527]|uniref:hypothetical protein n=1 Tax=Streptomyces sp. NBC_01527 TaxID=2903894 RepID=UPI002F910B39